MSEKREQNVRRKAQPKLMTARGKLHDLTTKKNPKGGITCRKAGKGQHEY
jgi:hypothetical protein